MSPTVTVRALATLAGYAPTGGSLAFVAGETVERLAVRLGLPWERIGTALRNGHPADPQTPLAPGDIVSFVPLITGG